MKYDEVFAGLLSVIGLFAIIVGNTTQGILWFILAKMYYNSYERRNLKDSTGGKNEK